MSDTQILCSYPLVFHRVRRVDAKYAYLVMNDGYIPLRRREGCLSAFLPYVKYGKWEWNGAHHFVNLVLETIDEVSTFFQTKMEDEYLLEKEYDVSEYGKLWDTRFDEMYGMRKIVNDAVKRKREKEIKRLYDIENIQAKAKTRKEREKLEHLYNHY